MASGAAVDLTGQIDLAMGQFIHVEVVVRLAAGQSNVVVFLTAPGSAKVTAYNQYPVPQLAPYAGRAWFGARSGGLSAFHDLDNVNVQYTAPSLPVTRFVQYLRSPGARLISYGPANFDPGRLSPGGALRAKPSSASITRDLEVLLPGFNGLILYGTQTDVLDNASFCPEAPNTRGQMAVFIARSFF
jgi:hypothetical protein